MSNVIDSKGSTSNGYMTDQLKIEGEKVNDYQDGNLHKRIEISTDCNISS